MNEWDQRIREHRVWNEMETLGPTIDKAAAIKDISDEALLGIERLRSILAYLGKRLAAADPIVSTPIPLEAIASFLTSVKSDVVAFVEDKDAAHVTSANGYADGALLTVSQVPGAYSPEELGALVSRISDYRKLVSEAFADAREKLKTFNAKSDEAITALGVKIDENHSAFSIRADALQSSLTTMSAALETEKQRLSAIVTEQQGQFSTSQDTRSKEFTESLRLANEGFTKLVTDYQSQFSAAQDTRGKEHTAAESTRQTKFNETIAEFAKKLADQDAEFTKQRTVFVATAEADLSVLSSNYESKAAEVLADIEEKRKHVEKLVGVIGNLGVTSGYLRTANQARRAMWGWQALTVAALMTLSGLAYKTLGLLEDQSGHFNWGGFAGRALLLVSLGVIAAYSGSQADKLFIDERRNRKLALELEAIGPYLAPLPVEDQNKFRVEIGDRSFGRESDPHVHRKSPSSVLDLFKSKESKEMLELMIEFAKKAKDIK